MDGDAEIYGTATTYSVVAAGKEASDPGLGEEIAMLFDGVIDETVYSGTSAFENVKIHFDKIMNVTSLDVYAYSSSSQDVKKISVYASIDGENYDFVTAYENSGKVEYDIKKHTFNLPGVVYANDIKVVVEAKNDNGLDVSEIEVFGHPVAEPKVRKKVYSYETEVPFKTASDIIKADANAEILSDGLDKQITSSGDYVSVIYDLGGFYQVEDILIKGNCGGFELLTSPDGYNYFSAGFYAMTAGEAKVYGRAENNAKFVKLVFHKPEGSNIILSEIELYVRKLVGARAANIVPHVTVKPNNILYIDWSDYKLNNAQGVYIEKTYFDTTQGLTPKGVYVNQNVGTVKSTNAGFCTYAGLEPECDYYVAVAAPGAAVSVTPVKITTNSAVGGDTVAGIFCINEYDGGSYVQSKEEIEYYVANGATVSGEITQAEIDAIPENPGVTSRVAKLLSDMEVISKNRHWRFAEVNVKPYLARGISWFPLAVGSASEVRQLNSMGVYTFGVANEPEITARYQSDADLFGQEFSERIESSNATLKGVTEKGVLYAPTLCGTDGRFGWLGKLYEHNDDMAEQYDIIDVHLYTKKVDNKSERIEGAESICVPENIANKAKVIEDYLDMYGDKKDLVATEIGWSRHRPEDNVAMAVTEEEQAQYVVRTYLTGIMSGIKEIFLYAFQDEGYLDNEDVAAGKEYIVSDYVDGEYKIFKSEPSRQHQYGIVDWYGNPHKGYFAYYTLGKVLKNTYFVGQREDIGKLNYCAEFYDEVRDEYITVLWNIDGDGDTINIESDEDKLLKLDMYGNASYIGNGTLNIGSAPVYIYSDAPLSLTK